MAFRLWVLKKTGEKSTLKEDVKMIKNKTARIKSPAISPGCGKTNPPTVAKKRIRLKFLLANSFMPKS